jgi:hypothetical protein
MRALLVVVLLSMAVPAFAQTSLGELAAAAAKRREEREKKEPTTAKDAGSTDAPPTTTPPKRVYTNKDLPASASKPLPTTPASPATATTPVASETATPKGESYWRERLAPYRARIIENADKVIALRRRIIDLTIDLSNIGPLNARRGGVETERQRLITEADALDASIKTDKAAIAVIEEEGRRAGALPGWFR